MNSVREIALTFSAAAIVTAAFSIFGTEKLGGSLRYVLSLGLICSVLSVAVKGDFQFFAIPQSQNTTVYTTEELYHKEAEIIIENFLAEEGIYPTEIAVKSTKKEDGSIVISSIEIYCSNSEQEVVNALTGKGIDCEIRVAE